MAEEIKEVQVEDEVVDLEEETVIDTDALADSISGCLPGCLIIILVITGTLILFGQSIKVVIGRLDRIEHKIDKYHSKEVERKEFELLSPASGVVDVFDSASGVKIENATSPIIKLPKE